MGIHGNVMRTLKGAMSGVSGVQTYLFIASSFCNACMYTYIIHKVQSENSNSSNEVTMKIG